MALLGQRRELGSLVVPLGIDLETPGGVGAGGPERFAGGDHLQREILRHADIRSTHPVVHVLGIRQVALRPAVKTWIIDAVSPGLLNADARLWCPFTDEPDQLVGEWTVGCRIVRRAAVLLDGHHVPRTFGEVLRQRATAAILVVLSFGILRVLQCLLRLAPVQCERRAANRQMFDLQRAVSRSDDLVKELQRIAGETVADHQQP